jgi:four helix bundle suffix protein
MVVNKLCRLRDLLRAREQKFTSLRTLLINVATYWLRQLIEEKTTGFLAEGGFSERLYRIRSQKRKSN